MDGRVLIVLLPILIAGGWAVFNIGKVAMSQLQEFMNKEA
ncbi:Photosystem II protein Y [Halomicronema hongdechloris C2206]|uniref:Photosystem II reaction center protein Y n=1 Tax=Halomicronema hongdechloris C2206 TaxID=1641165 RepID=A0A1V8NHW3_9CYAN|nr:photosystem II protein Y [Halomicronema hongdechloris]ASC73491.1 Photosystem II protein Y [Halomicronema hongdechloris C2206]